MGKITIATAPCSWGVWYADGTPSGTPAAVFLDQAAQAGYESLELGPDGYLPTEEAVLRQALDSRKLSVCAGTACYAFDQYQGFADFRHRVDALCSRIQQFGGKYLVTMDESDVGQYSEKKQAYTTAIWDKYFSMFRDLGEYTAKEYGIKTVYHPHIKSLIETEEEILRLLNHTGLDLCFDTGHHAYVNGNGQKGDTSVPAFLKAHAQHIAYLHFKQVDGNVYARAQAEHWDSDTAFDHDVMCDLPDGIIDFTKIKHILDEINFTGIAVVESDMPRATTERAFAAAKRNLQYLREIKLI